MPQPTVPGKEVDKYIFKKRVKHFFGVLKITILKTHKCLYTTNFRYSKPLLWHAVAQLVEALGYKPEGRGLISEGVTGNFRSAAL